MIYLTEGLKINGNVVHSLTLTQLFDIFDSCPSTGPSFPRIIMKNIAIGKSRILKVLPISIEEKDLTLLKRLPELKDSFTRDVVFTVNTILSTQEHQTLSETGCSFIMSKQVEEKEPAQPVNSRIIIEKPAKESLTIPDAKKSIAIPKMPPMTREPKEIMPQQESSSNHTSGHILEHASERISEGYLQTWKTAMANILPNERTQESKNNAAPHSPTNNKTPSEIKSCNIPTPKIKKQPREITPTPKSQQSNKQKCNPYNYKYHSKKLTGTDIALIVIASVAFLALLGLVFTMLFWKKKTETSYTSYPAQTPQPQVIEPVLGVPVQ